MTITRLVWVTTTTLFAVVGAMVGWTLGTYHIDSWMPEAVSASPPHTGETLICLFSGGSTVLSARLGSWIADKFLLVGLGRVHQLSAADRILAIVGLLVGMLFGVLLTLALPSEPWFMWLPIKLCIVTVSALLGMAVMQGMRGEMLRVFPVLDLPQAGVSGAAGPIPKILDTNIIIDGRMTDLCKTGFIEGPLYVPSFVLEEVQYIADSSDSMRRARGRRGLDVLNAMREIMLPGRNREGAPVSMVHVLNTISPEVQRIETVDSKLVLLATEMGALLVTNDYNLNRVAALQGVTVLNINELAQALKPVVLPGEEMSITIVKEGKEPGQGVGYLEDGTMVVVGDGQHHIGENCKVAISSVYQTVAGKMIFAELKNKRGSGEDLFNDGPGGQKNHETSDDLAARAGGGARRKGKG